MLKNKGLALSMTVLTACATAQGVEHASSGDVALVATSSGIEAVSLDDGHVAQRFPEAVVARGADRIVTTSYQHGSTEVTTSDLTGKVIFRAQVKGDVLARIVTDDYVALTARAGAGETPYLPAPKERTWLVILDEKGHQRGSMLRGNFEPEAFSLDRSQLFMIEYIPPMAPDRYRVRRLHMDSGKIKPIGRLKLNAPGQMQGTGRTQVMAPAGHELYTLYTQQLDAGHDDEDHGEGFAHAFVHVLNLDQAWAHCIDLPAVFASGLATASAIAVNPSGSRVFVADWTSGAVAALNPHKVRLARTATGIDFGSVDEETFAAASDDRIYVAGNGSIVVLNAEDLSVEDRWEAGDEVVGLVLEDAKLFVATSSSLIEMDAATGRTITSASVAGATGLESVVLGR
jgi:hypothetical protein